MRFRLVSRLDDSIAGIFRFTRSDGNPVSFVRLARFGEPPGVFRRNVNGWLIDRASVEGQKLHVQTPGENRAKSGMMRMQLLGR